MTPDRIITVASRMKKINPIDTLENRFCIILAIMSVPPVVASARKTSPRPIPEITPPDIDMHKISFDRAGMVNIFTSEIVVDERTVAYSVPSKNVLPNFIVPIINIGILSKRKVIPESIEGCILDIIVTIPDTPPGANFAGSINREYPIPNIMLPYVRSKNSSSFFINTTV